MANYHEAYLGLIWLIQMLGGDATLAGFAPGGVWRSLTPPADTTPFVFISHQAGHDVTTMNGYRVMTDQLYQVAAVGPATNTDGNASAAARIDRLLGGPPGFPTGGPVIVNSVTEGQVLACYRESHLSLDEIINGELWNRMGGMYRLLVEQVAT